MKGLTTDQLIPGEYYHAHDKGVEIVFRFLRGVEGDPTRVYSTALIAEINSGGAKNLIDFRTMKKDAEERRRVSVDDRDLRIATMEERIWLKSCMIFDKAMGKEEAFEKASQGERESRLDAVAELIKNQKEVTMTAAREMQAAMRVMRNATFGSSQGLEPTPAPTYKRPEIASLVGSLENKRYRIGYINTDDKATSAVIEAKSLELAIKEIKDFKEKTYHIEL